MTEFQRFAPRHPPVSAVARVRFTRWLSPPGLRQAVALPAILYPALVCSTAVLPGCAILPLDPPEGTNNAALPPDGGTSSGITESPTSTEGPNVGTHNPPPNNGTVPNPGGFTDSTSPTDGTHVGPSDASGSVNATDATLTGPGPGNGTDGSATHAVDDTEQTDVTDQITGPNAETGPGNGTDRDDTTEPQGTDPDDTETSTDAQGPGEDSDATTEAHTTTADPDPTDDGPDVTFGPDTSDNGETSSTDDGPGPACPADLNPCGPDDCSSWVAACVSDADHIRSTSPSSNACNFDCNETSRQCSMTSDGYCPAACRHTDDSDCVRPNRIFVTRTAYDGNLGGLSGADQKCQASADAANLGGTFVAVLGTSTTTARSRLGAARGFIRVDDEPFADINTQLISGVVFNPPNINEYGERMPAETSVATGFQRTGQADYICNDWTTNQGSGDFAYAGYTGGDWRYVGVAGCSGRLHLYCAETNKQAVVKPVATAGTRKAFLAAGYDRASGLAGADARCNAVAQSAGVSGTFKALLGAAGQPASKRFNLTGAPWARIDGTKIVDKAANLADSQLASPLNQTADGQYVLDGFAWTGTAEIAGKPLESCNDWSATAAPRVGHTGNVTSTGSTFLTDDWDPQHRCTRDDGYLYCLEETGTGVEPPALPDSRANVMFVTSETYNANLGGLTGADQKCAASAANAGLSGSFVAVISAPTADAAGRLGNARGFVRPDGLPIAGSPIALLDGRFAYPPNLDAKGDEVSGYVWTGDMSDCAGWTSTTAGGGDMGDPNLGGSGAFIYGGSSCNASNHLYCAETSQRAALPALDVSGVRLAFLARGSLESFADYVVDPGVGLSGLDAQCQTEASLAGLSGTYKALVATTSATAASRFNASGAPYARTDGVKLSDSGAQFFAAGPKYPVNVTADGFEYFGNNGVWFGASDLNSIGTDTCNNWTSRSSDYSGLMTLAGDASFTSFSYTNCNAQYLNVTCLQQ